METSKAALRGFKASTVCRECGKEYEMSLVGMVRSWPCPHCGHSSEPARISDGISDAPVQVPGLRAKVHGRELSGLPGKKERKNARLLQKV